jgi:hypothetical protein
MPPDPRPWGQVPGEDPPHTVPWGQGMGNDSCSPIRDYTVGAPAPCRGDWQLHGSRQHNWTDTTTDPHPSEEHGSRGDLPPADPTLPGTPHPGGSLCADLHSSRQCMESGSEREPDTAASPDPSLGLDA